MDNSKPILLISPLPPPHGGIATWTKKIINLGSLPDGTQLSLVNTKIVGKRNIFDRASFSFAEIGRTIKIFYLLCHQLLFNRPKLIHLSCSLSSVGIFRDLSCVIIAKIFKLPVICHYRGNIPDFKNKRFFGLSEICLRLLINIASINIVENQGSFQQAKIFIKKENKEKIILLPNFIEDAIFDYEISNKQENRHRYQILFAGGITGAKGCNEILQIANELPDIDFHLFGKMHQDMVEQFKSAPKNIFLRGDVQHDTLLKEMCAADCLLFPSYTEGFPMVVLEAMSIGLPVIASNVGAIPEMVDEGLGGYLINPCDVTALVSAIKKLFAHPQLIIDMGKYNKQKSFNCYRLSVVVDQLSTIYNQVLLDNRKCVV